MLQLQQTGKSNYTSEFSTQKAWTVLSAIAANVSNTTAWILKSSRITNYFDNRSAKDHEVNALNFCFRAIF